MNWILCITMNNLPMTKVAIKSFRNQDIQTRVMVIDNGSTDGSVEWLNTQYPNVITFRNTKPYSVAQNWNRGLSVLFDAGNDVVLVCNNDVKLRPDTYRELLAHGGGFVTAVGNNDPGCVDKITPVTAEPRPHPDFSCYLIRKEVYVKVGKFDEGFEGAFCEDWDYHCRLHQAGIEALCIDLPFYHYGSATIKTASEDVARAIGEQADKNREYFAKKWGFKGASPEYEAFFAS